jgi:hypothetical protein
LILAYLAQGVLCGLCYDKGMLYDVLQPTRRIPPSPIPGETGNVQVIHPNVLLTDGVWLWPGALLYYVQEYHLDLPREFIHHAESHQWKIDPSTIPVGELNSDAFEGTPSEREGVRTG